MGLQIVFYTWSSRGDWDELFRRSGGGLVNRELTEAVLNVESPFIPRLGWLIEFGALLGLSESAMLWLVWTVLLCAGCCVVLGVFSRPAAIVAWLLHLCAVKSEDFLSYGMDNFTTIGLFYLMLSPFPDRLSVDWRLRWPRDRKHPSGFIRHVLQIHVCIIYFFGGIMKSIGAEWWNGNSVWRALTSPPYNVMSPEVPHHVEILPSGSWSNCLPSGDELSSPDLAQANSSLFIRCNLRNAPRHWMHNGSISLFLDHDRIESRGFWAWL